MRSMLFKIVRSWNSQFKCNYLENENVFWNFWSHFWNLYQLLKVLKKSMIVIANVFPKVENVKILVRPLSNKRLFRTRFDSQHVKASQILTKSLWDRFCRVVSSFSGKMIPKTSPLALGEILGVYVNTLTANAKYPAQDCENLKFPIWMILSQIWRFLLNFVFHLWTVHQIFNIFKKRMIVIANVFPKIETVKILVRPLSKDCRCRTRFDSQHVKLSQILSESPWERFCHVFSSFLGNFICKMFPLVLGEVLVFFFLTDWLPMASILFKIVRICNSQFKCNYLKNEKVFLNFLSYFWNLH